MVEWHSSHTNVTRVRSPDPPSYEGTVCCLFFSGFSGFPPSTKNNTSNSVSYTYTLLRALSTLVIAELRRPEGPPSGASIIIGKGSHVCIEIGTHANSFFMVNMASGMDHGRVAPTTTTTTTNDVAQHGGQISNTKSCSLGL